MSIEVDVDGVLDFSHILLPTSPALDEIHDIARLAGGCSSYMEGLAGGSICECLPSPTVLACKATLVATWSTRRLVRLTVS